MIIDGVGEMKCEARLCGILGGATHASEVRPKKCLVRPACKLRIVRGRRAWWRERGRLQEQCISSIRSLWLTAQADRGVVSNMVMVVEAGEEAERPKQQQQ